MQLSKWKIFSKYYDEIIDTDAKLNDEATSNDEETKTCPTNFNEALIKHKISIFY